MTDYIETYRKIPVDKIVEFDETPGFGPWKDLFSPESTKHPAKANLNMLRFLIERFTKPGDVILDPMSGTGSTGTMANLHGRNAILVEYEEKFANMCKDNMDLVKDRPSLEPKGSTLVVQGDARELSSILKEKVDFAMFSPPHGIDPSGSHMQGKSRTDPNNPNFRPVALRDWTEREKSRPYSKNPDNIGNKPYGDIDAVVTSPPHGDSVGKQAGGKMKWCSKDQERQTLPTYSSDPDNISNKPYGDVDAVVTSPPHGNIDVTKSTCLKSEDYPKKLPAKDIDRDGYSKDEENIANKEYGDISAILTSPPHGKAVSTPGDPKRRAEHMKKAGLDPKIIVGGKARCGEVDWQYSDDEENLGNLPYGKVSHVITSPPYEGGPFDHGGGHGGAYAGGIAQRDPQLQPESTSEGNIAQERGKTYLEAMVQVYSQSYAVLKPGGLMIIIVKNFSRNWKAVRLDLDTQKLCEHIGFELVDHLYRKLKQKSFWVRNYERRFRKKFPDPKVPLPTAQFEDILVFQKPSPS